MTLVLTVSRCPDGVAAEERRLRAGTISIGRGPQSDWVLPDPGRVLSKRHCVVACDGSGWQVADTSSNGTFLNHEKEPLGAGSSPRPLRDGDLLSLGGYEIGVAVQDDPNAEEGLPDLFGPAAFRPACGPQPAADPEHRSTADPFPPVEDDPLGVSMPPAAPEADFSAVRRDDLAAAAAEFRPPRPSLQLLPDDWDAETPAARPDPRPGPAQAAGPDPVTGPAPIPAHEAAAATAPAHEGDALPRDAAPAGSLRGFAALIEGAGVAGPEPADPEGALRGIGAAFRAAVCGLRQTMIARTAIKSGFRIEQTMMQAAGNNPLKFSADDDDALAALLGLGRRTEMSAERAVREAVRDIHLHELATANAMQRAMQDLFAALAPAEVEARTPAGTFDFLPGRRAARLWKAHRASHASMARTLTDGLDGAFGRSFMRAYERAMREAEAQTPLVPVARERAGAGRPPPSPPEGAA